MKFATKTLEFDKILNLVIPFANSKRIKERIFNLEMMINPKIIQISLNEVEDALISLLRISSLSFDPKYDIIEQLDRLQVGSVLSTNELLLVKAFLRQEVLSRNYSFNLKKLKIEVPNLLKHFNELVDHQYLLDMLNQIIDDDGIIYDSASTTLHRLRRQINSRLQNIKTKLDKLIIKYSDFLNEKVIVTRNDRYCLCFNASYKNKIKGVIHDISSSGQTIYIEPDETRSIMAEIELFRVEENQEIQRILADTSKKLMLAVETLKNNLTIILELDFIFAKANYANSINAINPKLNQDGLINLNQARHPLIDADKIVPINFYLDKTAPTMIITGPNTGGKTVALKTVGLLTLMAQSGLLIPANPNSVIAVFNNVYADIGDEQSLEQSLSTFSAHMTKLIDIINNVDKNDLVLIDEIGSGTDPIEGTSLAIAILDYLRSKTPNLVVTTHYSELKVYAFEQPDIITASVAFDEKTLEPKYHLQIGLTGSSNAILIANRLGLDTNIIKAAKQNVEGRQTDVAKVIEKLSIREQELDHKNQQLEILQNELTAKINEYNDLLNKNADEQNKVIKQLVEQETQIWNQKHLEIQRIIKDLKSKQAISTKEEAEIKAQIRKPTDPEIVVADYDFKVGDYVYITTYQQSGVIIEIKNEQYLVDLGPFSLNFKKSDLQLTAAPKTPKKTIKKRQGPTSISNVEVPIELDLRGVRYDEVYNLIDQAVDKLILANLKTLRIIHGFGTGAVKNAVHEYIKSSSHIKSHRFGGENEGMLGVTIITLK